MPVRQAINTCFYSYMQNYRPLDDWCDIGNNIGLQKLSFWILNGRIHSIIVVKNLKKRQGVNNWQAIFYRPHSSEKVRWKVNERTVMKWFIHPSGEMIPTYSSCPHVPGEGDGSGINNLAWTIMTHLSSVYRPRPFAAKNEREKRKISFFIFCNIIFFSTAKANVAYKIAISFSLTEDPALKTRSSIFAFLLFFPRHVGFLSFFLVETSIWKKTWLELREKWSLLFRGGTARLKVGLD